MGNELSNIHPKSSYGRKKPLPPDRVEPFVEELNFKMKLDTHSTPINLWSPSTHLVHPSLPLTAWQQSTKETSRFNRMTHAALHGWESPVLRHAHARTHTLTQTLSLSFFLSLCSVSLDQVSALEKWFEKHVVHFPCICINFKSPETRFCYSACVYGVYCGSFSPFFLLGKTVGNSIWVHQNLCASACSWLRRKITALPVN